MPSNASTKISVKELQSKMINMDHARFDRFKSYIRTKARKELNSGGITKQDPARWVCFKMQIVREFPELLEYEKQWPIEAYFRQFTSFETKARWNKSRAIASTPSTPPKRRMTFFAGATPRHRPHCITRLATDSEILTFQVPLKSLPLRTLSISHRSGNALDADAHPGVSQPSDIAEVSPQINDAMDQAYTYALQEDNIDPLHYPVPCVKCGAIPKTAPSCNREISKVLLGSNALISVLSSLGIVSDHHLSVYRQLGPATFLNSLRDNTINPLHKAALEKYLTGDLIGKQRAGVHDKTVSSSKFKALSFPQPSPEHEARIIQSTSSEELRKAMGLEDDVAHYILLTKYIDDAIKGMDMQLEQGEWSSIVNKICDDCPELNDFQNTWPISFYVKWKHARIFSGRLQKIMPRVSAICSATNRMTGTENIVGSASRKSLSELSQVKRAPWSGCLIHPLPRVLDASPKLLAYLRAFGMEELFPVFLSAGIKTDDDFDLYSSLDEEGRKSVFSFLGKTFNLRSFQTMMLDIVIREASI